jgi:V8-like Glu-specific endopeptidase
MGFRTVAALALLGLVTALGGSGCAAHEDASSDSSSSEDQLVGGTRDSRWSASGYLLSGASMETLDASKVACSATVIAPRVVVTAAHCVVDTSVTFAFGTGDVGSAKPIRVIERHADPSFHADAQGDFDLDHALRKFDVAYLVLESAVPGVAPAELVTEKPPVGCNVQAIGFRTEAPIADPVRVSTAACVLFRVQLGSDPIFEVHPAESSALCHLDGDEGSPVVNREGDKEILVGIYVGSVTQSLTDCRQGTQFLDGYESMFGYGDFLRAGIASVAE